MTWKHVAIVGIVCASLVGGCAAAADARRSTVYGKIVRMDNCRQVECVVAETYEGVSLSCDWAAK